MKICFIARWLITQGGFYRFVKNVLDELNKTKNEIYLIHDERDL